jgi:hypothetical protein
MATLSNDENRLTEAEQGRRDFMKAAGKLAIYTPPALMLLMRPSREAVAASAGLPQTSQTNGTTDWGNQSQNHDQGFWLWRVLSFWN